MWLHSEVPGGHEFGERRGITVQPTAGASTIPEAWMVDAENTLFIGCCDGEIVLKRALGGKKTHQHLAASSVCISVINYSGE